MFKKKLDIQFLNEKSNFPVGVVRDFFVKKIIFFLEICLSFGHVKPVVVVTLPLLEDPSLSPPPTTVVQIRG